MKVSKAYFLPTASVTRKAKQDTQIDTIKEQLIKNKLGIVKINNGIKDLNLTADVSVYRPDRLDKRHTKLTASHRPARLTFNVQKVHKLFGDRNNCH